MNRLNRKMSNAELAFALGNMFFGFTVGAAVFDAPYSIFIAAAVATLCAMLATRFTE